MADAIVTSPPQSNTLSQRILHAGSGALERSTTQRFMRDASAGTIAPVAFARYLAIEEAFVQTAARVSGYCLWSQQDWTTARWHAEVVGSLVGEQLDYFAAMRPRWGAERSLIDASLDRARVLGDFVLGAMERSGYAGAVVSMFAAETLYETWCSEASGLEASPRHADVTAWIELHTTDEFAGQVSRLAAIIDDLPESDEVELSSIFIGMLAAEDAFHAAVYDDGRPL